MVFGVYHHGVWLVIKESWWGCHCKELAQFVRTVVLRFEPLRDLSESPDARLPHCTTDFLMQLFQGGTRDCIFPMFTGDAGALGPQTTVCLSVPPDGGLQTFPGRSNCFRLCKPRTLCHSYPALPWQSRNSHQ